MGWSFFIPIGAVVLSSKHMTTDCELHTMNMNKIKTHLESVLFDLNESSSIETEKLASSLIEEKSLSYNASHDAPYGSMSRQAMHISKALLGANKGEPHPSSSICYGYAAIGAILNSPNHQHTAERISTILASAIDRSRDSFSGLALKDKIEFVDKMFYRFVHPINSLSSDKENTPSREVKGLVLTALQPKLDALDINTNFIPHALSEHDIAVKESISAAASANVSGPSQSIKK